MKKLVASILLAAPLAATGADLPFTLLVDVSASFQPEESSYCGAASVVTGELLALAEKGEPIAITLRTVGANDTRPVIHRTRAFGTGTHSAKHVAPKVSAWLCSIPSLVDKKVIKVSAYETALFAAINDVARDDFGAGAGGALVILSDGINHSSVFKGESHLKRGLFPAFPSPPQLKQVRVVGLGFGQGVPEKLEPLFQSRWKDYMNTAGASFVSRKYF